MDLDYLDKIVSLKHFLESIPDPYSMSMNEFRLWSEDNFKKFWDVVKASSLQFFYAQCYSSFGDFSGNVRVQYVISIKMVDDGFYDRKMVPVNVNVKFNDVCKALGEVIPDIVKDMSFDKYDLRLRRCGLDVLFRKFHDILADGSCLTRYMVLDDGMFKTDFGSLMKKTMEEF